MKESVIARNLTKVYTFKRLIGVLLITLLSLGFWNCNATDSNPTDTQIQDARPNILFIMSDDHTSQAWGIYGGVLEAFAINDNIKRITNEGAILENVFCTNSICVPSRGSILTGQYSHQNGIYTLSEGLHPDTLNIAKILQQHNYETAIIGKWHLKEKPNGFDHFLVLPGQGRYHDPILKNRADWQKGGKVYEGFSADVIGDQSVTWLQHRSKEKPFFLMTHFKATHEPFDYPERYNDYLANVEIPEPDNLMDFFPEQNTNGRSFIGQQLHILGNRWVTATANVEEGKRPRYPGLPFSLEGLDKEQAQKKIYQKFVKDFLRSGAAIDDNIGKLLDYLEESGLAENTIVIYTADQGYFLGEHGFFDKRMIYEEALRMPFVIRYPKEIKPKTKVEDMILNIDFPSLFADYAGIDLPDSFHGRSFRSNLRGITPADWRNKMYYRYWLHQTNRPAHFGIRNNTHTLAFFYGQNLDMPGTHKEATTPAWEFYDLQKDPNQNQNAINDPAYAATIQQLKQELLDLRQMWGDTDENYLIMKEIMDEYYWPTIEGQKPTNN